jgi:hypothetical protein
MRGTLGTACLQSVRLCRYSSPSKLIPPCNRLLATKESVILFVAHNNLAANKVYRHVGFAGLDPDAGPVEGVSSWLEIGFDRNWVELGHW